MRCTTICLALLASLPGAALAEGLDGREMTFRIVTYDDPANMIFESATYRATVGPAVELGLAQEGKRDFDLIPVIVDVSAEGVVLDYAQAEPGAFYKARFNGYVLDFGPGCPGLAGARLDPDGTTMAIGNKRVSVDADGRLLINVSDLSQDRRSRIAVTLTLAPCS